MKKIFRKYPLWVAVALAIVAVTGYWSLWATDRYVSEANVVLQSAQIGQPTFNFASILKGGSAHDLLMLRDHLLSVDMLKKLDGELGMRQHYSDKQIDMFSRLSAADVPLESFHRYYLKRVSAELDEHAQVLRIRVQAYTPEMAQRIAVMLLTEGEAHMNAMGQRLAAEQVRFIERQVEELNRRANEARNALLAYQNEHGLVSPTGTVEGISSIVASLEAELAKLSAQRKALASSHSERSPEMIRLNAQIRALRDQIIGERARLAGHSGDALNKVSSGYESLRMQLEFALELYSSALTALETTRVEAARTLQQISILQAPTLAEYSAEPRRAYNVAVFTILAVLGGLIGHLMIAIIRDHRD